jgi:signal transduction histidine kinase
MTRLGRRLRVRRVGVRTRVLVIFGVGAMVLSGVLALATLSFTTGNLRAEFDDPVLVDEALGTLRTGLTWAAVVTTLVGLLLGQFAAERVVRPLTDAARAARAIADGRLDTRLEVTDDPDLRELSESFNEMVARLQRRVERDARFASDVSHELRSPLTTLTNSIEVLRTRRDELSERSRSALDLLDADVQRFRGLVSDLLEISRYDAGAVRLLREPLRLGEFVRAAVGVSSLPATPVKCAPEAELMTVMADKRRLARVVANLIDNARVHSGGVPRVQVCAADGDPAAPGGGEHAWIIVEDDGEGIPPAEYERVFDRFTRGSNSGNRSASEGAGLGLALVREHVRLHGGRVWTERRPDGRLGARFVIELPLEAVA